MTPEQFLDKWCAALNGGDQRHVHNDLERVLAPPRAEIARLNKEIAGHLDRLQSTHDKNALLKKALGELIAYEWGTGDLAVGIGRAQVHVQADGNLTVWGRAAALLEKIRDST